MIKLNLNIILYLFILPIYLCPKKYFLFLVFVDKNSLKFNVLYAQSSKKFLVFEKNVWSPPKKWNYQSGVQKDRIWYLKRWSQRRIFILIINNKN